MRRISQLKRADCTRLNSGSMRPLRHGATKSAPLSSSPNMRANSGGSTCTYCGEVTMIAPLARSKPAAKQVDSPKACCMCSDCTRAPRATSASASDHAGPRTPSNTNTNSWVRPMLSKTLDKASQTSRTRALPVRTGTMTLISGALTCGACCVIPPYPPAASPAPARASRLDGACHSP